MPRYPKYATTVIGAHSVPDWYEPLDRLMAMGQLAMPSMADAQYRVTDFVWSIALCAIDSSGKSHCSGK